MTVVSINPKAQTFSRVCLALAKSGGSIIDAATDAERRDGPHSPVARILKAAVSAGTLNITGDWGGELGEWSSAAGEYIDLVRNASIVGRLQGLRQVPLQTRMIRQTGGARAFFVAEGAPIPVSASAYVASTIYPRKVAAITVVTDELIRSSSPLADAILRNDLVRAQAVAVDTAFISDAAGTVDEAPAGVMHGAPVLTATNNPRADLAAMIEAFRGTLEQAAWVMDAVTATQLSGADYPAIGARGGTLLGLPVITSAGVVRDTSGGKIALIDPTRIEYGEGGMAEVAASRDGAIYMSDTPTSPSDLVSLYQTDSVGIRAAVYVNWQADTSGVLLIGVNY